ncbi:MAG: FMN-binding protein [Streptococcaceae bacterium]|nr:FMN-binding protein [Streptococcaceae bacterium]
MFKIKYLLPLLLIISPLSACQKQDSVLNNGTFQGVSAKDDEGAFAKVKLKIVKHQIQSVDFQTIQKDGSIKDASYGKRNGEIHDQVFYNKAQLAVKAMDIYREQLEQKKSLKSVEVISGATISYNQFKEAVNNALEKAAK